MKSNSSEFSLLCCFKEDENKELKSGFLLASATSGSGGINWFDNSSVTTNSSCLWVYTKFLLFLVTATDSSTNIKYSPFSKLYVLQHQFHHNMLNNLN